MPDLSPKKYTLGKTLGMLRQPINVISKPVSFPL